MSEAHRIYSNPIGASGFMPSRKSIINFLSPEQLRERGICYSTSHLRRLVAEGKFPAPVKLAQGGENACRAYVESEIDEWQAGRIAERDARRRALNN